jgi:hypothetical protein
MRNSIRFHRKGGNPDHIRHLSRSAFRIYKRMTLTKLPQGRRKQASAPQGSGRWRGHREDVSSPAMRLGQRWLFVGCRANVIVSAEGTVGVAHNPPAEIICTGHTGGLPENSRRPEPERRPPERTGQQWRHPEGVPDDPGETRPGARHSSGVPPGLDGWRRLPAPFSRLPRKPNASERVCLSP